jgi:hypothetical protein
MSIQVARRIEIHNVMVHCQDYQQEQVLKEVRPAVFSIPFEE